MVRKLVVSALAALMVVQPVTAQDNAQGAEASKVPLIIAHRGASGDRPEHTLAAYELAIEQGADFVEPDLVVTKDLQPISRHENELSGTTDVANREEFEHLRREKTIDGRRVAGWFAEDFTLAELRTLRAKERVPSSRPANTRYNGLYQVPTLAEIVQLVRAKEAEKGRRIGIYPELKTPTFLLEAEGIDMVDLLLRELRNLGVEADEYVFIQCFEVGTLRRLDQRSDYQLVQLIAPEGGPVDEPDMRYADMITPSGLTEVAEYADGIGPWLGFVLEAEDLKPTNLVADAHAKGLVVHPWTLRKENGFLPAALHKEGGPAAEGQWERLFSAALASGADGFFVDNVKEFVWLWREG